MAQYFRWEKESIKRSSCFKSSAESEVKSIKEFCLLFFASKKHGCLLCILLLKKKILQKVNWKWMSLIVPNSLWSHGSPWNSPGQNTGVGSLCLLQGIFPTQGSNPGLLHCRQIHYQLSHRRSPDTLKQPLFLKKLTRKSNDNDDEQKLLYFLGK